MLFEENQILVIKRQWFKFVKAVKTREEKKTMKGTSETSNDGK